MKHATKTLNPIHFEDLEPHRFEDLVRQLSYGFKTWSKIEATGKSGGDDGIDIRAFEKNDSEYQEREDNDEVEDTEPITEGKEWRIQCKREKTISASKINKIFIEMFPEKATIPYGLILAAACDFSKKTRDAFRDSCISKGIQEFHIWSKSEIEDMLYQPKNDRIMFGFFGISLSTQRKSISSVLNRKIVLKKKLIKLLGDLQSPNNMNVLLRDPEVTEYPRAIDIPDFEKNPKWIYMEFIDHKPVDGLLFLCRKHFAMINPATKQWDYIDGLNLARFNKPTLTTLKNKKYLNYENQAKCREKWLLDVPDKKMRATYKVFGILKYESILAIDEVGDAYNEGPHLLVSFKGGAGPFDRLHHALRLDYPTDETDYDSSDDLKIDFFKKFEAEN